MAARVELSQRGKVGFAGACAVCCVVPLLVLVGAVSIGALLAIGVAAASIAAVVIVGLGVGSGRLIGTSPRVRQVLLAVGGVATVVGLLMIDHAVRAAAFISVGLALLACSALLAIPAPRGD